MENSSQHSEVGPWTWDRGSVPSEWNICIQPSSGMGFGVFARKDFYANDVIMLEEAPIVGSTTLLFEEDGEEAKGQGSRIKENGHRTKRE